MIRTGFSAIALFTGATFIPMGSTLFPNVNQSVIILISTIALQAGILVYLSGETSNKR